ncbi:MAG: hypothetical protein AB9903_02380 [Vulcanimicrobiota bacterium]
MKGQKGYILMRFILRILFLLVCGLAVVYGLTMEKHQVYSLSDSSSRTISGPEFAEMASFDGVMKVEGQLYDIYSVAGISIKTNEKGEFQTGVSSGGTNKPKDCKT